MALIFDEKYFNETAYLKYQHYPHFKTRAEWIKNNIKGTILVIGCAYGYLLEELEKLGIIAYGVEKSEYAYSQIKSSIKERVYNCDIIDLQVDPDLFDWVISWNVLDCLDGDKHASQVAKVLSNITQNQLHVVATHEQYIKDGYMVRPISYWTKLFPGQIICFECGKIYNQDNIITFTQVPLMKVRVSE